MADYFAFLREREDRRRVWCERIEAARTAQQTSQAQYYGAWNSVFATCATADISSNSSLSLTAFRYLANVLKSRGYDRWLPEMADNVFKLIDDHGTYRPAQLFFVQLLIEAGKPETTEDQFAEYSRSFVPAYPVQNWRETGARDVQDYMGRRIQNAIDDQQRLDEQAAKEAEERWKNELRQLAKRKPALEEQLFAVYWTDNGLGVAAIRDKWNDTHPRDPISAGEPGRDDIKKAIIRGRAVVTKYEILAEELAHVLGFVLHK